MEDFTRLKLYQLIISQLQYDGYTQLADMVSMTTTVPADSTIPKGKLDTLVQAGLEAEQRQVTTDPSTNSRVVNASDIKGIDLDDENYTENYRTQEVNFDTSFIATHKLPCIAAAFSPDGSLAATGSQDNSVKLIDVNRILDNQNRGEEGTHTRVVLTTFYGSTHRISSLAFHPTLPILGSASDVSIKFYDLASRKMKKEMKDTHSIRSIKFHPSGDYVLVGTDHHQIRLYDYSTRNAYISPQTDQQNQHQLSINQVDVSPDGRMFASCSDDGNIKIWDGRNLTCVTSWEKTHGGAPVYGVSISKNGKYLLSSGDDHIVKMWDISAGKVLYSFPKVVTKFRCPARFSYDERFVFTPDELNGMKVIDTYTQVTCQSLFGHSNGVRCISSSPVRLMVISGSEDFRARFWDDTLSASNV